MCPRLRHALRSRARRALAALVGGAGIACAAAAAPPADVDPALQACPEVRPQMCTRDYRPACGHRCDAPPCAAPERRTYGNACSACADPAVKAVTPGSCAGGEDAPPPILR